MQLLQVQCRREKCLIRQREREFAVSTGLMQVKFAISVRLLQVVQEREVFDQTKFAVTFPMAVVAHVPRSPCPQRSLCVPVKRVTRISV